MCHTSASSKARVGMSTFLRSSRISRTYRGVTTVLQCCCSRVTIVLQECYNSVTVVSQCGHVQFLALVSDLTHLQGRHKGVAVLLQWCYNSVTIVLQ
jgi:hypothetical protein